VEEDWVVVVDLEVEVVSAVGLVLVGAREGALVVALELELAVGWVVAEASGVALEVAGALVVAREPVVGSVSELEQAVGSEVVVEVDLEEEQEED